MQATHGNLRLTVVKATVYLLVLIVLAGFPPYKLLAQPSRITAPIDNSRRVILPGHIRRGVVPANDQGGVDASLQLPYVTMALRPSSAQKSDLEGLLQRQQDPSSPDFHHWLTPEEYADRFGVAQSDIDKIAAWLQSQGLTVLSVARGRNAISFKGPVRAVESAFGIEIHHYLVKGELHFANATNPSVPAALNGVVLGIHGLNDFKMRPAVRRRSSTELSAAARPGYVSQSACGGYCLAPSDFATIYNVNPLYNSGINGSGQKLAVVGQTEVNPTDLSTYRSFFHLTSSSPTMMQVPNDAPVPAVSVPDLPEASLDLEVSGGVAPNATVIYVYSNDVEDSVEYAIDQNVAPVVSMSYGQCEEPTSADGGVTSADALTLQGYAQRANAQGMTWLAAAGDNGAADCYGEGGVANSVVDSATVDYPGSIPEVTSVGGSEFDESSEPKITFWSSSGSALSYIPEMVWNDSVNDGTPSAGGGGASIFFTKPSWQIANGVPNDGKRDVPDISLAASADHDPTLIFCSGDKQDCGSPSNYSTSSGFGTSGLVGIGGTSVGAPSMAGIVTLLNQYLVQNGYQTQPGVGNINPRLYGLQNSAGVFHDITVGNNIVTPPCPTTKRGSTCTDTAVGFNAGPGYDLASGLGSMNVYNMVLAWHQNGETSKATPTVTVDASVSGVTNGGVATLTATLIPSNGGTPTGTVNFLSGTTTLGTATLSGGTATLSLNASELNAGANSAAPKNIGASNAASFQQLYAPGMILAVFGSNLGPTITAVYSGDSNYNGATATALGIVAGATSTTAQTLSLPTTLANVTVTIAGVPAPIYFVSSGQLNVQIPYETPINTPVILTVNNNGQSGQTFFKVGTIAPGIFSGSDAVVTDYNAANGTATNGTSAAPGDVVAIYITGDGAQNPQPTTGSTPASNLATPSPTQTVTVSVQGASVQGGPITPAFVGIPSWSIGVTQINFTVPASAIPGTYLQIIVTVGNTQSAPVNLNIVQ